MKAALFTSSLSRGFFQNFLPNIVWKCIKAKKPFLFVNQIPKMVSSKSKNNIHKILFRACRNGQLAHLIRELSTLDLNAASTKTTINDVRTNADETLLHLAAAGSGDANGVTQYLLRHGADANVRGCRTQAKTALHEAARVGHISVCALLLESGARVDAVKSGDWTPLMVAASAGYGDVVELLLSAGANVTHVNREGASALHLACRGGNERCVNILLHDKNSSIMVRTRNLRTPLHYAARAGWPRICQFLCENGADKGATDTSGCSAAHEAAEHSNVEVLRIVFHNNAWKPDCGGLNVLHYAAIGGQKDVVLFLLNSLTGVMETNLAQRIINMETAHNLTPLALAMLNNHLDVVRLLLFYGARVRDEWIQICQTKGFDDCVKATQHK